MKDLNELYKNGQSVWYDYISRKFIVAGELQSLINIGLKGITSNPSIFQKAISDSNDYDDDISRMLNEKLSDEQIYERLAFKDIGLAADKFAPVYKQSNGTDGFVSIEVNPDLAHNTKETIAEAKRIFSLLKRPNIMIKVPGTVEGLPAITELIASGINVNITLLFSVEVYKKVVEAYIKGLEELIKKGGDIKTVNSVASFFVSRIDNSVDKELDKKGNTELKGKIAIANAKKAYQYFIEIFNTDRWKELEKKGAKKQRLLWASTSTKNPAYPDTLYIDNLIGKDTVNTIPPATLKSYLDHGSLEITLDKDLATANSQLEQLNKLNISLDNITDDLTKEGIEAFSKSFNTMMQAINEKVQRLNIVTQNFTFNISTENQKKYEETLNKLKTEKIVEKIWKKDFTVWNDKPDEISNRLGWLKSPGVSLAAINEINEFATSVINDGYKHVLLMGMGGSSLAPEVFSKVFRSQKNYPDLAVLDSTHPETILEVLKKYNPAETLYIVSTKSGGTVETFSFMKFFYNHVLGLFDKEKAGKHFVAITDPGSGLESVAKELNFRKFFLNDPDIGGRYSALSFFGIVPAALLGIDIKKLLTKAAIMQCSCETLHDQATNDNTSANLGCLIASLANEGRDKLTFITSDKLSSFGSWAEQLIAESTGKLGKGILPVDGESIELPEYYSNDRVFVHLKLEGDNSKDVIIENINKAGHPLIQIIIKDIYELGGEFFRWEMATAIMGWKLGIQPFDQPNVESAKILARKMVDEYKQKGKLPEQIAGIEKKDIKIYWHELQTLDGNIDKTIEGALESFFSNYSLADNNGTGRSYVCIQAYLKPDDKTTEALQTFRTKIQKKLKTATTLGYGPRFLHSTGQLHKGDAGKGLFIQFIDEAKEDAPIPDEPGNDRSSMSFGVLIKAQALGDRQALIDGGRKVITIDLGKHLLDNLKIIEDTI